VRREWFKMRRMGKAEQAEQMPAKGAHVGF
jgi:hypothetical protein